MDTFMLVIVFVVAFVLSLPVLTCARFACMGITMALALCIGTLSTIGMHQVILYGLEVFPIPVSVFSITIFLLSLISLSVRLSFGIRSSEDEECRKRQHEEPVGLRFVIRESDGSDD